MPKCSAPLAAFAMLQTLRTTATVLRGRRERRYGSSL
jgi:hypothetical protein